MSEEKLNEEKLNLEELYKQSIKIVREGQIVKGKIISLRSNNVLVDVGFKSEGIVPIAEFSREDLEVGKELDFLVDSVEDDSGAISLSRDKAMRIRGWDKIVKNFDDGILVDGKPVKKVKGGFLVDVAGIEGFLPASLSAFKNVPDKEVLFNAFKFKIVKVNNFRRSIILSRREAIQKERDAAKEKIWHDLKIGGIYPGTVKAITDFGAFIDLGGVDGLLHIRICPGQK